MHNRHKIAEYWLEFLKGMPPEYLHITPFWGGFLSQWYPASFNVDRIVYTTAEHFMMAEKARTFGDHQALKSILATPYPKAAKETGRTILGYDDEIWSLVRYDAVIRGNIAKFTQHPELRQLLLNTRPSILVEASPYDRIWGVGLGAEDAQVRDPNSWKGLNYLGFALMEVREMLV